MSLQTRLLPIVLAIALFHLPRAHAAPEWRLVASSDTGNFNLPNLPTNGSFFISVGDPVLSDSPAANMNFVVRLTSSNNYDLWRENAGLLLPYAQMGATGATGPARIGAEANHVFRRLVDSSTTLVGTDTNAEDARVFSAFAGDPAVALDATSIGAWIAGPAGNTEFARVGVEGAFGPNIGAGWSFSTDGGPNLFGQLHALPGGAVLIQSGARFTGTAALPYDVLARHQPGAGNSTCSVTQATNPAWAPGVLGNDYFESIRYASSSPRGEVYAAGNIARQTPLTVRTGIWQFCAGAPQVKVLSENTGALGPNIPGISNAVFRRMAPGIGPSTQGAFYFSGENAVAATTFKGLFHHSGGQNRPILLKDVEGALGPQVPGFIFSSNLDYDPISAGQYAVLGTSIRPVAGTSDTFGLWRLRPNASPEPIAVVENTGSLPPAAGRRWRDLGPFNILENGDVIFFATTTNPPPNLLDRLSLWRIRPGRVPEEILKPGDQVRAPTAAGTVLRAISRINRPGAGNPALRNFGGDDSWLSASGQALISVQISPPAGGVTTTAWVRTQISDLDVLLQDGFE